MSGPPDEIEDATPRIVRDFAFCAAGPAFGIGLLLTIAAACIDLETVGGVFLVTGGLSVALLLAGAFVGMLLGLAHTRLPESPWLWPLGFGLGAVLALPLGIVAGDGQWRDILFAVAGFSALFGPPLGFSWALWLLLDRRGRNPWPALLLLSAAIQVVLALFFLGSLVILVGPVGPPPPPPVVPAPIP